jgi:hypothetical protein
VTTTTHPDHERIVTALDTMSGLVTDTSRRPWEVFEDHGRDMSDEGYSYVGMKDQNGEDVGFTWAMNYEANDNPEADTRLIVTAVNTYDPMLTLVRYVADRHRPVYDPQAQPGYPGATPRCVSCCTVAPCEEYAGVAAVVNVELSMSA